MSSNIRGSLTKWFNRLRGYEGSARTIVDAASRGEAPTNDQLVELRRNLRYITDLYPKIEAKQTAWEQLIERLNDEEKVTEQQEYDNYQVSGIHFAEFMDDVDELLSQIRIILEEAGQALVTGRMTPPVPADTFAAQHSFAGGRAPTAPIASAMSPSRPPNYANYQTLRLPKLQLRRFDGDPRQWQPFWQCFDSAVNQQNIPDVQKLNYLVSVQDGDAARAIQGYAVTAENYAIVLEALRTRFGDPKVVADTLEAELINLPRAGESVASLRDTSEAIERICRQFTNMGMDENSALFVTTAKSKLPRTVLTELVKEERRWKQRPENTNRIWGMKEVREALKDFIAVREEVTRCVNAIKAPIPGQSNVTGQQGQSDNSRRQNGRNTTTARAFAASTPAGNVQAKNLRCLFCGGAHWCSDCRKVAGREDRKKILVDQKRCFRCLRIGHSAPDCRKNISCRTQDCGGPHNTAICPRLQGNKSKPGEADRRGATNAGQGVGAQSKTAPTTGSAMATVASGQEATKNQPFLMTRWIDVSTPKSQKKVKAMVFFDPGSQLSFVSQNLVSKLRAASEGESDLEIYPFGSRKPRLFGTTKHRLNLQRPDGELEELVAHSTRYIGTRLSTAMVPSGHSTELTVTEQEPDVLVGLQDFWRFFVGKDEVSPDSVVVHTTLGDVLCGQWRDLACNRLYTRPTGAYALAVREEKTPNHDSQINEFWSLETLGIRDDPQESEDLIAMKAFEEGIRRNPDGRYVVGWPWRDSTPELPTNYGMAHSRLAATLLKLQANMKLAVEYDALIKSQLNLGIIERAQRRDGGLEHYLPHHAVITHKLRIVYDASAHGRGLKSLNQCLLRGPVILPQLVGFLIRFRATKYPVLADIEKAFLQLELKEDDREVAKFLWVHDVSAPLTTENLVIYRFARVAFGVISSPFLLAATIRHHLRSYATTQEDQSIEDRSNPDVDGGELGQLAAEIEGDTYVDNILLRCDSSEEARRKSMLACRIFSSAKMTLREFVTNAPDFSLPSELMLNKEVPKVLGIPWHTGSDVLRIGFPSSRLMHLSRRTVLKTIAGVFDPLGLVNPCLLRAKLFFQSLWDEERSWDTPLSTEEIQQWREIEECWVEQAIAMPRMTPAGEQIQLHAFVDAAKDAYSCSVYLRCQEADEKTNCHLIFAKSRLRPKRSLLTIPRMELMSMMIGVRALAMAKAEIQIEPAAQFLWGDSKVVLAWLNSAERQPRFVENRLTEIRRHDHLTFGYVNTAENPADIGTRGASAEELQASDRWWKGPEWLAKPSTNWPTEVTIRIQPIEQVAQPPFAVFAAIEAPKSRFEKVDWSRFDSWAKWVRVFAQIRRFANACRKKYPEADYLSSDELKKAEIDLYRIAQVGHEVDVAKKQLRIQTDDDGIIRLVTRMGHSSLDEAAKSPILLPKGSPLTRLIFHDVHVRLQHAGVDRVLTEFLLRYWSRDARRLAKAVCGSCSQCSRLKSPSYALPPMPDLPADRVTKRRAFESVGIDYLGPTTTRSPEGTIVKVWILLITCLTTRAVWLEPLCSLSTQDFLHGFNRFVSRRGRPARILSDNGTQFRLAAKVLADHGLDDAKIDWRFIGGLSPWQGGVYERLVALVKSAFKATLGRRVLNSEEMRTFTAQVEASLNSRPITAVSTDPDAPIPLRPVDFLNPTAAFEIGTVEAKRGMKSTAKQLVKFWDALQSTMGEFWNRFTRDYLLMLRDKSGWFHRNPKKSLLATPKEGEIVLVEDRDQPRNLWSLARIIGLEQRAGAVRNVRLRLPAGRTVSRPINRIYPMEAAKDDEMIESVVEEPPPAEESLSGEPNIEMAEQIEPSSIAEDHQVEVIDPIEKAEEANMRPVPTRTHRMQTRRMAKAVAALAVLIVSSFTSASNKTDACQLLCLDGGVYVQVREPAIEAYWCCGNEPCHLERAPTLGFRPISETINYDCNIACLGELPSLITCKVNLDSVAWPWILLASAIGCSLAALAVVIVWKRLRRSTEEPQSQIGPENPPANADSKSVGGEAPDGMVEIALVNVPSASELPPQSFSVQPFVRKGRIKSFLSTVLMLLILSTFVGPARLTEGLSGKMCPRCEVTCSTRGVDGKMSNEVMKAEICCRGHICDDLTNVDWQHALPPEVLINEYSCNGFVALKNGSSFAYTIECPAVEACELIECTFCLELIANPGCFPIWTLLLYGLVVACAVPCICCSISICRESRRNIHSVCSCFGTATCGCCRALQWFGRATKSESEDCLIEMKSPGVGLKRTAKVAIALLGLALSTGFVKSDDAVVLTAMTENCYRDADRDWCDWDSTSSVTLLPAGQRVSLLMKATDGDVYGTLRLRMDSLTTHCVKQIDRYFYPYETRVEIQKRCPGMGSCHLVDDCSADLNEDVSELKNCSVLPCRRYCTKHCSAWWCGCPMGPVVAAVVHGCLFYGTYAWPLPSQNVSWTFTCPSTEHRIAAKLELETASSTETKEIVLYPGMTLQWMNMSITPLSISQAPAPILTRSFITEGESVALANDIALDLDCPSRADAEARKCSFIKDPCVQCTPDKKNPKVDCQCRHLDVKSLFDDFHRRLPISVSQLRLRNQGDDVFMETNYAPIQLMVKMAGLRLIKEESRTKCWVTPTSLKGCYACFPAGADFHFRGSTASGSALAKISCDGVLFVQRLTNTEGNFSTTLHFDHATIDMKCLVECSGGSTEFHLRGELRYLPRAKGDQARSAQVGESVTEKRPEGWWTGLGLPEIEIDFDFKGWVTKLLGWNILLPLAAVTLGVVIVVNLLLRCHPIFRGYRKLARLAL